MTDSTDKEGLQITFKPGGLALLAGAAVLGIGVVGFIGLRGRSAQSTGAATVSSVSAASAPAPAPVPGVGAALAAPVPAPIDFGGHTLTPVEIEDKALMVRLAAVPGQQRDWLVLGPLLPRSGAKSLGNTDEAVGEIGNLLGTPYLSGEATYQAQNGSTVTWNSAVYTWRKVTGSALDFRTVFATRERPAASLVNTVAYACTTIESKTAAKKVIHFRSDDGAIVWLNGRQIVKAIKLRGISGADNEDVVPVTLHAGRNSVLVKVGQNEGGWAMSFQVQDPS